jgi:hypothetical protein
MPDMVNINPSSPPKQEGIVGEQKKNYVTQEVGGHIRDLRVRLSALGTFVSKMGLPLVRLGIRLCFDGVRLRL